MIKRAIFLILAICVLLTAACGSNGETDNQKITPQPVQTFDADYTSAPNTFGTNPAVEVVAQKSYYFVNENGNQIYFAIEYNNSGDCPIVVQNAIIKFKVNGIEFSKEFEPVLYNYFITFPNDIGYIAVWTDDIYSVGTDAAEIEIIGVSLEPLPTLPERYIIGVKDIRIVQNYTEFATVTGSIELNNEEFTACTIFCAFYDESNNLLGVWFFSLFDDTESFTSQLISLPIPDLAQNTKSIKAVGFGID